MKYTLTTATQGGLRMTFGSRIVGLVVSTLLLSTVAHAQVGAGAAHGKVLDRDGKALQGAVIRFENLTSHQTDDTKTNKNGDYSIVGLFQGKYRAILMVGGKGVMVKGDGTGNEIVISDTTDTLLSFDLRNAPAAAVAVPASTKGNDKATSAAEKKAAEETKAAFAAGLAAMKSNNFEEAVKQLQLAAEKDPNQPNIYANLGFALTQLKKYDEALAVYNKALALKPDDAATHSLISLALAGAGKIEEATQEVQQVAKLDPSIAGQAYYNLGIILTNRGKSKEAVESFKKAIEIDPKNAPSYYQLGIAYFGSPDTIPQAVTALQKFLELQPTGPDAEAAKQLIAAAKPQGK
jgi:tetratricopeptide (TPR) repeat protein